ncbi:hypothetical protein HPP92_021325 [Vanilla planifolia]|uniref:Uncharacterized protein n=1 Tax=Vanilla planifolia TaxID=51239 RepID=A0A835Q1R6_VANPL|nr:hypothetical protein HPP92_021325 [Vanilla planifolia]
MVALDSSNSNETFEVSSKERSQSSSEKKKPRKNHNPSTIDLLIRSLVNVINFLLSLVFEIICLCHVLAQGLHGELLGKSFEIDLLRPRNSLTWGLCCQNVFKNAS